MEISKQLTSLSLSNRLKELGVKQDSYFSWSRCSDICSTEYHLGDMRIIHGNMIKSIVESYSAFSVAELGELLPYTLRYFIGLEIYKEENSWIVKYVSFNEDSNDIIQNSKKLADAMAKMFIYLFENKLIKVN